MFSESIVSVVFLQNTETCYSDQLEKRKLVVRMKKDYVPHGKGAIALSPELIVEGYTKKVLHDGLPVIAWKVGEMLKRELLQL